MKRRILSLLLALCMLAAVPMTGFAAETEAINALTMQGLPAGLTRTAEGGILVTDTYNHMIWLLDGQGISPLAGALTDTDNYGKPMGGYRDGNLSSALFCQPWAITPFLDGYAISDRGNNAIRYLTDDKVQTLLLAGNTDGVSTATGLAADGEGNLYFSDPLEGKLWKMSKTGKLSLFAEGLSEPMGLCWQGDTLYVAETGLNRISAVKDGKLTPVCGSGEDGFRDGGAKTAQFSAPQALTAGEDGTLYISDTGNGAVRRYRSGTVTTLLSSADQFWGVCPCGLILNDGVLLGADNFSGGLFYLYTEEKVFADVDPDKWYADAVSAVVSLGLMKGTDKGFEPESTLNRAMLAQMLLNAAKMLDRDLIVYGTPDFTDVQESDWFYTAVGWAQKSGLVSGVGNGRFAPYASASRQELAVMLYRLSAGEPADPCVLDSYQDAGDISSWAVEAMCWAVQQGILQGSEGCLHPTDSVKRAEAAAMLLRFYTK